MYAYQTYVYYPPIYLMFIWIAVVLDSSYAQFITTVKYRQPQHLAVARHAGKESVYVGEHVTCRFGRALKRVHVLVVLFLSHNPPCRIKTNHQRRINTIGGETGFQKQLPHSRRSAQTEVVHNHPQRYTTALSRSSLTSCLCDSHGDFVWVVYTQMHRSERV